MLIQAGDKVGYINQEWIEFQILKRLAGSVVQVTLKDNAPPPRLAVPEVHRLSNGDYYGAFMGIDHFRAGSIRIMNNLFECEIPVRDIRLLQVLVPPEQLKP